MSAIATCDSTFFFLMLSPSEPDDNIYAFAEDVVNLSEKSKDVFERVESIVGKGENAGYQHFLLFPQCFQKSCVEKG